MQQKTLLKKDVYNAKIKNIEDKIPSITNLAPTAALNAKGNEVKKEVSNITNLATILVLPLLQINYLMFVIESKKKKKKKKDYNTEISEIENNINTMLLLKKLII